MSASRPGGPRLVVAALAEVAMGPACLLGFVYSMRASTPLSFALGVAAPIYFMAGLGLLWGAHVWAFRLLALVNVALLAVCGRELVGGVPRAMPFAVAGLAVSALGLGLLALARSSLRPPSGGRG